MGLIYLYRLRMLWAKFGGCIWNSRLQNLQLGLLCKFFVGQAGGGGGGGGEVLDVKIS